MATYQFSALADGQAINFNPNTDVLNFDNTGISGADISAATEGSNLRISFGSKDVLLTNVSALQITTTNIAFANGSRLFFGDNTTGTANDNSANALTGTAGNDQLNGLGGVDTLNGGLGDDLYVVTAGDVLLDSGGIDTVVADINWTLGAGFENLTMAGTGNLQVQGNSLNNHAVGNSGNNYFNLRAGNDTIEAGAGNDTIDMSNGGTSSYGNDVIFGGDGIDTVDFDGYARSALQMNAGGVIGGGASAGEGLANLISIERFIAGAFDDTIHGGAAAEYLDGRGGNDTIGGREGNDTLIGGVGADTYLFDVAAGASNADQVTGFVSGTDRLVLDGLVHAGSGPSGAFGAGDQRFWASSTGTAHDASDRFIYNTATGQLWHDADGNGSGAAQLIATLQGAPSLAATDISVVNGEAHIVGTNGDDSLVGTAGNDTIEGLGGNDTIDGNGGADSLVGGDGDDRIENGFDDFSPAGDTLIGGNGNDTLDGTSGGNPTAGTRSADTLDGGLGNDYFNIDEGDVVLDAGGIDTIQVNDRDWILGEGFENLWVKTDLGEAPHTGIGNAANNEMWLTFGGGRLEGLAGNDTLHAGSHESDLFGGDGDDLLIDKGRSGGILDGGAGNDTLLGEGATLTGGAGADHFAPQGPETESSAPDTITDFASGVDHLQLDGTRFRGTGPSGDFTAADARFFAAAGASEAHDASDRLIYNTSTGNLYYDEDGTGSASAFLIATLQGAPALTATDIEVVNGSPGGEHLVGTAGDDSLVGSEGNDTIDGRGGNDLIDGAEGADYLIGGAGNDTLKAQSFKWDDAADTLDGGMGDDVYWVSDSGDTILADPGGVDTVVSWLNSWTLGAGLENLDLFDNVGTALDGTGNELDNTIRSATEGGTLRGLGGNDTLILRHAQNTAAAYGGDGNDTLQGGGASNLLYGEAGNDLLVGGAFSVLDGGTGNDTLSGGDSFHFTVAPGAANADFISDFDSDSDIIWLDSAAMSALGASGVFGETDGRFYAAAGATGGHDADDRVVYNTSTRQIFYDADGNGGGAAQLIVTLQSGASLVVTDIGVLGPPNQDLNIQGGAGDDSIAGGAGNDTLRGGSGNDTLAGNAGQDSLAGEAGADSMTGGDGSDTLDAWDGSGGDTLDGGFGDDAYYVDVGDVVLADAGGIDDAVFASGTWTLGAGIEILRLDLAGSVNADGTGNELGNFIWGSNGANRLSGGDGDDWVIGNAGADTLSGGAGNDTLQGGDGADVYVFDVEAGAADADSVTGFQSGFDRILLTWNFYSGVGSEGTFNTNDARFWASPSGTAHDADDRIVYNTSTGQLWYDGDGNGGVEAEQIANLGAGTALAASDISLETISSPNQTLTGTSGNDTLTGGSGNDTLLGLAGNDYLEGRGGQDSVVGGDGNDTLWGADPANSHLYEWEATDTLDGGFGDDVYHVRGDGAERVDTVMPDPGGIDTIHVYDASHYTLAAGFENVIYHPFHNGSFFGTGNELDNLIDGGAADYSELRGMGGNDTLDAGIFGGGLLDGGDGNDVLRGSFDHGNTLDGGNGVDTMTGGEWDDVYYVTAGDVVTEGADNGVDTVNSFASWTLGNNFENLTLLAGGVTANGNDLNNVLTGNNANNTSINGRAGNDTMYGMGGNDTFDMSTGGTSSYGNDVIDGGAGIDSVEFGTNARSAVNINLTAGTVSGGGDGGVGSATLVSVENALGGNFNDLITGSGGANLLRGSNGNDTLNGKAGVDQLNGGAGNDAFVFDAIGTANADVVQDFAAGADKLNLENAVMTALGATGNFAADDVRFWAAAGATSGHDANDRVVYNSSTGNLYYDADGNGAGVAQLIATIQGHPAVGATDIAVI